jgi:DNA helicase HerA-like ATPase
MAEPLPIAKDGDLELFLLPALANRHGLITGATGTGKTVSLQVLAERFSALGVPVFMADVKGDLAGMSQPGAASAKFDERLKLVGVAAPAYTGFPTVFWDVFGESGHPMRATVSDLGPLLFARILNLNETQEGVLALVFKIADDNGLLLLDLKDLRALLEYVGNNPHDFLTSYGNVSAASVGAIQRGLLALQQQGADKFIGEPMLNIDDLLQTDGSGKGNVNILTADKLLGAPALYSTLLLWLLSEFYERLPEVGDRDKPKLVFFFDEAHLLFQAAARQDRAGCAADPLQGRRRLFGHTESARRAGQGPGAARQPDPARAARVHAARPEGGRRGRRHDARQSEARYRKSDHRTRRRRSAGVVAR